jgi:hypothetical protein
MLRFLIPSFLLAACLASQGSWQPLFNGRDLTGWAGDSKLWRVEDGVIIGETDDSERKISANSFLIWQGSPVADFQLEFQARVTGANNSGVQYRSRVDDTATGAVSGYQFDLHPNPPYLGMIYDENGRGVICENGQRVTLTDQSRVTGALVVVPADLATWNCYRIVACGGRVRHFVNGQLVAEAEDVAPSKGVAKGLIALQLHTGAAMKVEFKDLKFSPKVVAANPPTAAWLWQSTSPGEVETVYFRREFQLPPDLIRGAVTVICDNRHRLFVNGIEVGKGDDWSNPPTYDVLAQLNLGGRNVIAVEGTNEGGPAGLALRFCGTMRDGQKLHVVSDASWVCSRVAELGWQQLDFQVSAWSRVTVVAAKMGAAPWHAVAMPPEE